MASQLTEKRRPGYDLDALKQAIGSVDRLALTTSALSDASAVGFDRGAIVETIGSVERRMFIKSMTTFAAIGCGRTSITCRSWIAALWEISGGRADRVHGRLVPGKVGDGHERRAASRNINSPETGETLARGVRPFTVAYKGESVVVALPGYYPTGDGEGIHIGEVMAVVDQALRGLADIARSDPASAHQA